MRTGVIAKKVGMTRLFQRSFRLHISFAFFSVLALYVSESDHREPPLAEMLDEIFLPKPVIRTRSWIREQVGHLSWCGGPSRQHDQHGDSMES